jgi:hypothetical protein
MPVRKTLIASLALAIAVAFSPLPEVQAATLVGPGSQPETTNLVQTVKAKKKSMKKHGKKMRKHKKGKRAGSKGPGRCGMNMYWKKGKCMDARKK